MRLLITALLSVHGAAMGQTFACQYTASAGLNWENGRWEATRFKIDPPFFLAAEGGELTAASVAKALKSENPKSWRCEKTRFGTLFQCVDSLGGLLMFDLKVGRGGVAKILGTVLGVDSAVVAPFTCQQM